MEPEDRFFSEGVAYLGPRENPLTQTESSVWDWDRLRMVKVKGTAKLFLPDEDIEISIMAPLADYLSSEVRSITVNNDGLLVGVSTDPEEDDTPSVAYLPLSVVGSLADCRKVYHSNLQELDRLGAGVDLVSYKDEFGNPQKVTFKFNPFNKPLRLRMAWDEINLLSRLPPHPNIVPFDCIVLEDVESRVIGFTTKYIPGGTLDNPAVPFRFEWLRQLTQLVDFLNLDLGIMHQDIAPRNLLIDPDTNKILLFDFDWAANGKHRLLEGRDDVAAVVFTLYEVITNDTHFTSIPHWDRSMAMVQSIPDWPCNRELDADVSTFRNFLNDWIATRKVDGDLERYLNAPNRLTCPDIPTDPTQVPFELYRTVDGEPFMVTNPVLKRKAMELGRYCFNWERPPQKKLLDEIKGEMH